MEFIVQAEKHIVGYPRGCSSASVHDKQKVDALNAPYSGIVRTPIQVKQRLSYWHYDALRFFYSSSSSIPSDFLQLP